MQNLKIKLNSEAEAEEVKRLAVKAGYKLDALFGRKWSSEFCYLVLCENMSAGFANEIMADGDKTLSIGELWAMVNPVKEYLEPLRCGGYKHHKDPDAYLSTWLEIHKDAEFAVLNGNNEVDFYTGSALEKSHFIPESIIWQREQDEPFLTPECTLNDQYAEIEKGAASVKASWNSIDMQRIENVAKAAKAIADSWPSIGAGAKANTEIHGTVKAEPDLNFGAAQAIKVKSGSDSDHALDAMSFGLMGAGAASGGAKDNVNHPSHYTQGKVECIDAIEAGMSEEMFEGYLKGCCNKYLWRYKMKGGSESLRKAQWYLDRLIKLNEKIESRN